MKIKLPHRTLVLTEQDKMLSGEDKVKFINEVLQETIVVNDEEMTLDFYFATTKNQKSFVAQDMISYFITKEHRVHQDILTRETIGKMQRGDGRTVNFSNLKYNDKVSMGLADEDDFSS